MDKITAQEIEDMLYISTIRAMVIHLSSPKYTVTEIEKGHKFNIHVVYPLVGDGFTGDFKLIIGGKKSLQAAMEGLINLIQEQVEECINEAEEQN